MGVGDGVEADACALALLGCDGATTCVVEGGATRAELVSGLLWEESSDACALCDRCKEAGCTLVRFLGGASSVETEGGFSLPLEPPLLPLEPFELRDCLGLVSGLALAAGTGAGFAAAC